MRLLLTESIPQSGKRLNLCRTFGSMSKIPLVPMRERRNCSKLGDSAVASLPGRIGRPSSCNLPGSGKKNKGPSAKSASSDPLTRRVRAVATRFGPARRPTPSLLARTESEEGDFHKSSCSATISGTRMFGSQSGQKQPATWRQKHVQGSKRVLERIGWRCRRQRRVCKDVWNVSKA